MFKKKVMKKGVQILELNLFSPAQEGNTHLLELVADEFRNGIRGLHYCESEYKMVLLLLNRCSYDKCLFLDLSFFYFIKFCDAVIYFLHLGYCFPLVCQNS